MRDHRRPASGAQDELELTTHDGTKRVIPIGPQGLSIGRAPGSDLVLDHPSVSRKHARIEFDGTHYRVVDLGSTNGTFLGDIRLLPAVPQIWTPDRTLTIGDNRLRLRSIERPAPEVSQPGGVSRMAPSIMPGSLAYPGTTRARVGLFVDDQDLSVEAGGSTTSLITILNQGSLVDHFQISVSGVPAAWVHIAAASVRLLPGASQDIPIVFMPPRSPQSRAGPHGISIKAQSRDAPDQFSEVVASLSVQAYHQFDLEIRPKRRTSMTSGRFQLLVTNRGNAQLTIGFEATDPEELGQYGFQPQRSTVPPGQTETIQLEVRSQTTALPQKATTLPFTVTARPAEAPEVTVQVQGEWMQSPPVYELELRPQSLRGTHEGSFALHVTNSSDANLTVQLSAFDPEETCTYAFSPGSVSVPPRQERVAKLRVHPKIPLPGSEPRRVAFTVEGRAAEAPLIRQQAQGDWTQVPPEFAVAVEPQESSGLHEGSFTAILTNQSDTPLTFRLSARDPAAACKCVFDSAEIAVPPGQSSRVKFKIQPKAPRPDPTPATYPVTIIAGPAGFPGVHREATLQWTHLPPAPTRRRRTTRRRATPPAVQKAALQEQAKVSAAAAKRRIPIWLWLIAGLIIAAIAAFVILGGESDGGDGKPTPTPEPDVREVQPRELEEPEEREPPTRTPFPESGQQQELQPPSRAPFADTGPSARDQMIATSFRQSQAPTRNWQGAAYYMPVAHGRLPHGRRTEAQLEETGCSNS